MIAVEKWFVLGPEGPIGPVTIDQLRRGLAAGKVPSDSVVSPEGSPAWSPIEEVLAEMSARDRAEIAAALGSPSVVPLAPGTRSSVPPRPIPRPAPSRKSAEAPAPAVAPSPAPMPSVRAAAVPAPAPSTRASALPAPAPSARAAAPVVVSVPTAAKTDPRPVSDTSLIPVVPVPAAPKTDPRPVSDTSLLPSLPPSQRPSRKDVPPAVDSGPALIRGATREDFLDQPLDALPPREPAVAKTRPSLPPAAPKTAAAPAAVGDPRYAQATLACAVTAVILLGAIAYRAWEPRKIDREQIHADALAVMTKHEGVKRAARCEQALADQDELTKGKPYAVERTSVTDICRVVSKGRPGSALHGGLVLSPVAECGRLEATLPREITRHEEKLSAVVAATCSGDRKPSALPDDAAKLAARAATDAAMPRLLRDAAAGGPQGNLLACYESSAAASGAAAVRDERKLRCSILKARTGTALPAATTLQRAGLEAAFETYRTEHAAGLVALRAQDREQDLVEGFLSRAEAQACGTSAASADDALRLSSRALAGCLAGD